MNSLDNKLQLILKINNKNIELKSIDIIYKKYKTKGGAKYKDCNCS